MVKTYDPKQVGIIVGTRPLTGYEDGTFVNVTRNSDSWSLSMGADGEGTRSKSNDKSGRVEITLKQSSSDNEYMSELALADELSGGGTFPVLVRDASGTSLYAAETAWVVKPSDSEFAKESSARTWMLETDNLAMFVGSN